MPSNTPVREAHRLTEPPAPNNQEFLGVASPSVIQEPVALEPYGIRGGDNSNFLDKIGNPRRIGSIMLERKCGATCNRRRFGCPRRPMTFEPLRLPGPDLIRQYLNVYHR